MWAAACGRAPGQGAGSVSEAARSPGSVPSPHCTKQGLCRGRVAHWGPKPPFEPELPRDPDADKGRQRPFQLGPRAPPPYGEAQGPP